MCYYFENPLVFMGKESDMDCTICKVSINSFLYGTIRLVQTIYCQLKSVGYDYYVF